MKNNVLMLIFLFLLNSCNENKEAQKFSSENNWKIPINILVDSCWNAQKTVQLKIISNEKFMRTMNGIEMAGNQEEIKAHMQVYFNGFPDLELKMNEIYSADNRAFTKWIFTGTNTGIFGESPATGKKVKILGSSFIYFNNQGEIIREDVFYNELDLLQQLGYTINLPIVE